MADTSPIQPLFVPRNISTREKSGRPPFFIAESGVAEATISASSRLKLNTGRAENGFENVLITLVQEKRNTLAARTGLTMFFPSPPNTPFATIIAKAPPAIGIQSGTVAGRLNPRRMPLITAEKSSTVTGLHTTSSNRASKITHDATETRTTKRLRNPNT